MNNPRKENGRRTPVSVAPWVRVKQILQSSKQSMVLARYTQSFQYFAGGTIIATFIPLLGTHYNMVGITVKGRAMCIQRVQGKPAHHQGPGKGEDSLEPDKTACGAFDFDVGMQYFPGIAHTCKVMSHMCVCIKTA